MYLCLLLPNRRMRKMMLNSLRLVRAQPPSSTTALFPPSLPYHIGRKTSGVRFQQAGAGSGSGADFLGTENVEKMDKTGQEHKPQTGDTMSKTYGEGYATRSDDDGFGGIYGGNDPFPKDDKVKTVNVKSPGNISPEYKEEHDDVKVKEKSRHQPHASA